jgi:uncharacterized Fe-S cluster protein YjdI
MFIRLDLYWHLSGIIPSTHTQHTGQVMTYPYLHIHTHTHTHTPMYTIHTNTHTHTHILQTTIRKSGKSVLVLQNALCKLINVILWSLLRLTEYGGKKIQISQNTAVSAFSDFCVLMRSPFKNLGRLSLKKNVAERCQSQKEEVAGGSTKLLSEEHACRCNLAKVTWIMTPV